MIRARGFGRGGEGWGGMGNGLERGGMVRGVRKSKLHDLGRGNIGMSMEWQAPG